MHGRTECFFGISPFSVGCTITFGRVHNFRITYSNSEIYAKFVVYKNCILLLFAQFLKFICFGGMNHLFGQSSPFTAGSPIMLPASDSSKNSTRKPRKKRKERSPDVEPIGAIASMLRETLSSPPSGTSASKPRKKRMRLEVASSGKESSVLKTPQSEGAVVFWRWSWKLILKTVKNRCHRITFETFR